MKEDNSPMRNRQILFAVKIGAEDWQEELITEVTARIPAAKKWALANGFDRLRVASIDDRVKPDFTKAIRI